MAYWGWLEKISKAYSRGWGGVGGGGAVGIVGGLEKRILMAGGELGFKLLFSFLF